MLTRHHTDGDTVSEATYSDCETYRYSLFRRWGDGPTMAFIGLNPSTATEYQDDPTVGRCVRRAERLGFGGMVMLNIFAFRATDPKVMKAVDDPVGEANDETIQGVCESVVQDGGTILACWGTHGTHHDRETRMIEILDGIPVQCLGQTKAGHPKHPLYLRNDQPLELWH